MTPTISVLVVEDHRLVSQGIVSMLLMDTEFKVLGAVSTGEDAIETVRKEAVDVVLMDVNLGSGISGLQATRKIKDISPSTKVLILTMYTDAQTVSDAMRVGADGYLSKGASREIVLNGIQEIYEGRAILDPNVSKDVFGRLQPEES